MAKCLKCGSDAAPGSNYCEAHGGFKSGSTQYIRESDETGGGGKKKKGDE